MDISNGRLYLQEIPGKGRGVFSYEPIGAGEVIEICPVVPLPPADVQALAGTALYDYYFDWGESGQEGAIAMGFGSMYNHAYAPNATYSMYFEERILVVYALRDIPAHEEITFNYNGSPDDQEKVWFETE